MIAIITVRVQDLSHRRRTRWSPTDDSLPLFTLHSYIYVSMNLLLPASAGPFLLTDIYPLPVTTDGGYRVGRDMWIFPWINMSLYTSRQTVQSW